MNKIIVLLCLCFGLSAFTHKFYVSISQIDYNKKSESLQITCKVFTDDFERVLSTKMRDIKLSNQDSLDTQSKVIDAYIQKHLKLKNVAINYIGAELDFDVIWLYLESEPIKNDTIFLSNSILFDGFPEQKNIINVNSGDETLSYMFTHGNDTQQIRLNR